jgi:hypothetical protein
MLWRAMLRGTAVGLLKTALQTQGATVVSSADTPAPADKFPFIGVDVDDHKTGDYGSEPRFRVHGRLTIEVRVGGVSPALAEAALDTACETIELALLGGQGFDVVCTCTQGSPVVTPASVANIFANFSVIGTDTNFGVNKFVGVQSIDTGAGTITLTENWCDADGSYTLRFGTFIGLFEQIEKVQTTTDYQGEHNKAHVFGATIEIVGHASEYFDGCINESTFNGLNFYIDTIHPFDASSDFTDPVLEPFTVADAPRERGPDGRPEVVGSVDLPQPE